MKVIKEKVSNDLIVEEDTTLDGIVAGSAIVRPNVKFIINGIVTGNVVIESQAEIELNGIISGDVFNQGGSFTKAGILSGNILNTNQNL